MAKKTDYRVKIKVGDAEIEIQGAETGVARIVESLSDVLRSSRKGPGPIISNPPSAPGMPASRSGPADIRSFFSEKSPSSDVEAAAVAAYYNQYLAPENSRTGSIDSASLQEAFRMARWPLPAKTIFTLVNARNAGYLDAVGEGGQYRLNVNALLRELLPS